MRARTHPPTWSTLLLLAAAALGAAGPALAAELRGRVELVNEDGKLTPGIHQAVVYFTPGVAPQGGSPASGPDAEPFEIVTVRKDFQPQVLPVPLGVTVAFPNEDPILHNVFSVSGRNRFDLGLYRGGESKSTTFAAPGVVQVFCNVHHSMAAYVLVLETPYFARPETSGAFVVGDLPAGPGTLTVWHAQTETWTREIEVPAAEALTIRLEIVRKRVQKHTNKFGKPYSRNRRGKDYD
jgi:plastocyanin